MLIKININYISEVFKSLQDSKGVSLDLEIIGDGWALVQIYFPYKDDDVLEKLERYFIRDLTANLVKYSVQNINELLQF